MSEQRDDSAKMKRSQDGDMEAFTALVQEYERLVFSICYRMMGNAEDARDAAQETFTRLWAKRAAYDPARPLRPWLCRIASNICISELRRGHRKDQAMDETREIPNGERGPQVQMEGRELGQHIQAALERLSPDFRVVIVLKYLTGLSYAQIQETLGISQATLETRLFRARQMLRDTLGQIYEEHSNG